MLYWMVDDVQYSGFGRNHSNCSRIDMDRNIRQWNIICVDDDDYTQLKKKLISVENLSPLIFIQKTHKNTFVCIYLF